MLVNILILIDDLLLSHRRFHSTSTFFLCRKQAISFYLVGIVKMRTKLQLSWLILAVAANLDTTFGYQSLFYKFADANKDFYITWKEYHNALKDPDWKSDAKRMGVQNLMNYNSEGNKGLPMEEFHLFASNWRKGNIFKVLYMQ